MYSINDIIYNHDKNIRKILNYDELIIKNDELLEENNKLKIEIEELKKHLLGKQSFQV